MMMIEAAGWAVLALWIALVIGRGGFWRIGNRLLPAEKGQPRPDTWPRVTALVPARNEEGQIAQTLGALLDQGYPGPFRLIVIDDNSEDETVSTARALIAGRRAETHAEAIEGGPLPTGWTGKLWALNQGLETALGATPQPDYLLFIDADIVCRPGLVTALVERAEAGRLALVSIMAKLSCASFAERCIMPAFVYFFGLLYPFAWVNRPDKAAAAAAGGCMLIDRKALQAAGGLAPMRDALIDDCALARQMKAQGPIWLGFDVGVRSTRAADGFGPLRRMVVRSAYAELRHSPVRLLTAELGMAICFLAAPLLMLLAPAAAAWPAFVAWLLMALSLQPTLRFYRLSPLWGFALPAVALIYMVWTAESAFVHARGRGGEWKGRLQAVSRQSP